ncbi:hypothetical protein NL676_013303 [Syzygium grande]|nr:hypothetical protein NL676_013303 [Syzygium grande]
MAEKKVAMEITVDLKCYRCYKKIKKVNCKFPEIQNQVFNEKENKVLITVVSCCPERIRDKIARKGGKTVESIKIVPEKPKVIVPEKPKVPEKKPEKKPKEEREPPPTDGATGDSTNGKVSSSTDKYIGQPVSRYPMIYPSGMYCQPPQPYYQGYGAVPYYHGVPAYYSEGSYGVNRVYTTNRSNYFSEENPESCTVM